MENTSYMDFGSDTDDEEGNLPCELDSDEEERQENETLLKMMMTSMPHTKTKQDRDVDEFQAEMEAELDKRALAIESVGGVEHQRLLSRSSSSSSLHKISQSPLPSTSNLQKSEHDKPKKRVKFAERTTEPRIVSSEPGPPGEPESITEEKKEYYDSIYFDSDESEGEDDVIKSARQKKRAFVSNDDLFYDPESDARDQAWVDRRRQRYCQLHGQEKSPTAATESSSTNTKRSKPPTNLPTSDAVLNCPACFTTVCLDCQRHDFYSSQYRAMFVVNCVVDKSETLRVPLKEQKSKKNKNRDVDNTIQGPTNANNDLFNPVKCKICATQVAVYDSEEVYHFFNVLASYA